MMSAWFIFCIEKTNCLGVTIQGLVWSDIFTHCFQRVNGCSEFDWPASHKLVVLCYLR